MTDIINKIKMSLWWLLLAIIIVTGWWLMLDPILAADTDINVSEYSLTNGLKLIVKEDRRAPVVVSQIRYKVGSSYDYNGIAGISHQLNI